MDPKRLNDLAAFLEGRLSDEEQPSVLSGLRDDPDMRSLLPLAAYPGAREEVRVHLPFAESSLLVVGEAGDYFRILEKDEVTLTGWSARIASAFERIAGEKFPVCVRGLVEAQTFLGEIPLRITLKPENGRFSINLEARTSEEKQIEVWKDGNVLRSMPASSLPKRPIDGVSPGTHFAFRVGGEPAGAALICTPYSLNPNDWKAASLHNAITGHLSEAVRILREEVLPLYPRPEELDRQLGWMSALGELTRSKGHATLAPLMATRSSTSTTFQREAVYLPLWKTVVATTFERSDLEPNEDSLDSLPENTRLLASTVLGAYRGQAGLVSFPANEGDERIRNGWACLSGWESLLNERYTESREAFESVDPIPGDPFHLRFAAALAGHLGSTLEATMQPEQEEVSSDTVWKQLFSQILYTGS